MDDLLKRRIIFPKGYKFHEDLTPVAGSVSFDDMVLARSLAYMATRTPVEPAATPVENQPPRFLDGKPIR